MICKIIYDYCIKKCSNEQTSLQDGVKKRILFQQFGLFLMLLNLKVVALKDGQFCVLD